MAVQVFVRTGERSLLNYLFKPLFDRAHVALAGTTDDHRREPGCCPPLLLREALFARRPAGRLSPGGGNDPPSRRRSTSARPAGKPCARPCGLLPSLRYSYNQGATVHVTQATPAAIQETATTQLRLDPQPATAVVRLRGLRRYRQGVAQALLPTNASAGAARNWRSAPAPPTPTPCWPATRCTGAGAEARPASQLALNQRAIRGGNGTRTDTAGDPAR